MSERRTKIAWERKDGSGEIVFRLEHRQWLQTRKTELWVSSWGLTSTGDLGGYKKGILRMPWERIAELHYGPQDRGAVGGLYAREGEWCSRCLLPGLSEMESDEVVTAIAAMYPRVARTTTSALERAVGESHTIRVSGSRPWWLPSLGRMGVALTAPSART